MMRREIVRYAVDSGLELRSDMVRCRWQIWPHLRSKRLLTATILAAFATLAVAFGAAAQGCAMCYQSAAASGAQGRVALRHAILILLSPAVTLFFGVFGLIFRRDSTRKIRSSCEFVECSRVEGASPLAGQV